MAKLCCGDLVLLVAQGSDSTWSPESSADPHPALGFLASSEHVVHSVGSVHRTATVEPLVDPEFLKPRSVLPCVFRIEAVLNREDIIRVDLQRKLDSHALEHEIACMGYGTEVKLGQCIRLVHQHTNQVLRINVNERGTKPFTMKVLHLRHTLANLGSPQVGFETQQTFDASCDVAAREQWLDSWLELQPPVKTKQDGDSVHIEDVVHLYSGRWERHLSATTADDAIHVVAGFNQSRWQLVPFAAHTAHTSLELKGGDILRFCHVESGLALTHSDDGALALSAGPSSNALWAVEPQLAEWGGHPVQATDIVQLRHVATNRLLCVPPDAPLLVATTTDDTSPSTRFRLKWTRSGATFHVQHEETQTWLCGVRTATAMPLHCCRTARDSDIFRSRPPAPREVFVLADLLFTTRQFARHCAALGAVPDLAQLSFQDVQPLETCLRVVQATLAAHPALKFIFGDQRVVPALVAALEALLQSHGGAYRKHEELRSCLRELCFLLEAFVTDDAASQRSMHPQLPFLQDLLGANDAVATALAACVRDNDAFLRAISRTDVDETMTRMAQPGAFEWAHEYWVFLETLCSCHGTALPHNQALVADALRRRDLLPSFHLECDEVFVRVAQKGIWEPLAACLDEPTQLYVANAVRLLAQLPRQRETPCVQFLADHALRLLATDAVPDVVRAAVCTFVTVGDLQVLGPALFHAEDFAHLSFTRSWLSPFQPMCLALVDSEAALTWEECMDQITPFARFAESHLCSTVDIGASALSGAQRQLLAAVLALCETCVRLGYYEAPRQLTSLVHVLVKALSAPMADAVPIKVLVCQLLSKLAAGRLNRQASALLQCVRVHGAPETPRVLIVDDCYAGIGYVDVLCGLCRHGCHELTMLALGLLYSYFNTLPELGRITDNLLVLASNDWKRLHDQLRRLVRAMTAESPEPALNGALDIVTAQPREQHQQMQRLLFHVGLHSVVIGLLQRPARVASEGVRRCYQILMHMIGCDRSFEALLIEHLDLFVRDVAVFPSEVSHFVRSVLLHNETLVQTISPALVGRVADLLVLPEFEAAPAARARVLEVLGHLVVTKHGEYLETNQNVVFNALAQHPVTLDLFAADAGYAERVVLMSGVDPALEMALLLSSHGIEAMLLDHPGLHRLHYHGMLLHLLAACSQGKNHRVEVECRSLLSLSEVVSALRDPRTIFSVRKALVAFLDAAYFDVQIPVLGLAEHPAVWALLQYAVHDLACVLQMAAAGFFDDDEATPSDVSRETLTAEPRVYAAILAFLVDGLLPMLVNFFGQIAPALTSAHPTHSHVTASLIAILSEILGVAKLPERTKTAAISVLAVIKTNAVLTKHTPAGQLTTASSSFVRLVPHRALTISVLRAWQDDAKRPSLWRKFKVGSPRLRTMVQSSAVLRRLGSGSFRQRFRGEGPATEVDGAAPLEMSVPARMRRYLVGFEATALYERTLLADETRFICALQSPMMDDIVGHVVAYMCQHDRASATNAHQQPHVHLNLLGWLLDGSDDAQQERLSRLGGSAMVLQLLAKALDDALGYPLLLQETLHVALAMLRGGNARVQADMFAQVQALGEVLLGGIVHFLRLPPPPPLLPMTVDLLELLRLLCENHFAPMQAHVRWQPGLLRTHDVLAEVAAFLCGFLWAVDPRSHSLVWNITSEAHLAVVAQAMATLAEFVQGCPANQAALGASTRLVHAVNDLLRHQSPLCAPVDARLPLVYDGCAPADVHELKHRAALLIYSLLEGNRDGTVARRVLAHLDAAAWSAHCEALKREFEGYAALLERAAGDSGAKIWPSHGTIDAAAMERVALERRLLQTVDAADVAGGLQAKVRGHWSACCDLYALFLTLFDACDEATDAARAALEAGAPGFFGWTKLAASVGSIEILRNDELEMIHFKIPDICLEHWEHRVIRDSRERMVYMFTKDSQISKLDNFHRYSVLLLEELQYCAHLETAPSPVLRLVLHAEDPTLALTFWLALALNGLHLFNHSFSTGDLAAVDTSVYAVAAAMAVIHFGASVVRLVVSMVSRRQFILSNYKWQRLRAEPAPRALENAAVTASLVSRAALLSLPSDLARLFFDRSPATAGACKTFAATAPTPAELPIEARVSLLALVVYNTKYNLLYCFLGGVGCLLLVPAWSVRGLRVVCYALMLLDVCFHRTLSNALLAVEQNRDSLVQTFYLVCVVVYVYTAVGYMLFHEHYGVLDEANTGCRTLMECVMTHFNQGLRQDIASVMHIVSWHNNPTISVLRLGFDVSYWLIICVLLLNIIGGIIIDAFGELRDHRSSIEKDMESNCFICGIDSLQFQRHGRGFDQHVRHEHNMWQYMFYRQHLNEKAPQDYTGQESYVAALLRTGETAFYPVGKARVLS
ncbi:hypothetical protein ACHHYP_15419 [Achlya hypogyna]|uniref:Uncharacterized protein n=1 Tax=Achlya hypogyna TaxID=1202772 RepID=A0A1V9ZF13_ACHHY|nr:hypothetical protein ACHHYP_15419 [Achlya hypogyna]